MTQTSKLPPFFCDTPSCEYHEKISPEEAETKRYAFEIKVRNNKRTLYFCDTCWDAIQLTRQTLKKMQRKIQIQTNNQKP